MDKIVLKIWAFSGIMGTWNRKTVRASVFCGCNDFNRFD